MQTRELLVGAKEAMGSDPLHKHRAWPIQPSIHLYNVLKKKETTGVWRDRRRQKIQANHRDCSITPQRIALTTEAGTEKGSEHQRSDQPSANLNPNKKLSSIFYFLKNNFMSLK